MEGLRLGPAPALRLEARPSHPILHSGATSSEYVLLRISTGKEPEVLGMALPRLTAVLVLDVSGSMQGTPVAQVKDAVTRMAAILGDDDSLGVVAFSTSARTVTPIRRLGNQNARLSAQHGAESLQADGYTNISAGLSHAALLFSPRVPDERQMILLLSDGQPNVGTQNLPGLSSEVALIKSRGIALSTLGFGAEHNEDILLGLADAGGGRYAFVKDPLMAGPSFAWALGAQRDVLAEDVHLVLSPGPGVEITRILGDARTSYGEGGLRVHLPDLLLGEEINVVAELKVQARRETGRWRLLRTQLCGRTAGKGTPEPFALREEVNVELAQNGPGPIDIGVQEVVAMATASELRQKARGLADQRNFAAASACLQQAREALIAVHGGVPADGTPLRDVYETILDDLQVAQKAPAPAEYSVLRKAQLDQQMFATGINRAVPNLTPSAQHMVIKLRNTHGVVPRARLICVDGADRGKIIDLPAECRIGRGKDNHFVVADSSVTRRHALIQWIGRNFVAHDLGSSSGTFVNGQHIVDDRALKDGDIIAVGTTRLRFEWLDKKAP